MRSLGILIILSLISPAASAVQITFETDRRLPIVYLNVAVKTGSVSDPKGKAGLTHFMGRLLLRGTKARTKEQIDLALDEMGAEIGVETRAEALILRGAVLKRELERFSKLLLEIITKPSFPNKEYRKLKSEISSELLAELGSDRRIAAKWFQRHLFSGHPYGRSINGTVKSIKRIKRGDLIQHYNRMFQSKGLLVVGSGDADFSEIKEFATKLAKARPGNGISAPVAKPIAKQGVKVLLVDKPDRTQAQIFAGQIGVRMTDPNFFPLYVGNYAFGGDSFQTRLYLEIREKRGLSYGVWSYFRHGTQPRSWQTFLFPDVKKTPLALNLTLSMMNQIKLNGITEKEFNFAKKSLINNAGFRYDTPQKRVENTLLERTLNLPKGFVRSFAVRINAVNLDQVNEALRTFIQPGNLQIAILANANDLKAPISKELGIQEKQVKVVNYSD